MSKLDDMIVKWLDKKYPTVEGVCTLDKGFSCILNDVEEVFGKDMYKREVKHERGFSTSTVHSWWYDRRQNTIIKFEPSTITSKEMYTDYLNRWTDLIETVKKIKEYTSFMDGDVIEGIRAMRNDVKAHMDAFESQAKIFKK